MDHERHHDDTLLRTSPREGGHRPRRIVLRLLAEGSVVVAMLASGWWGMSLLGAHALASEKKASFAKGYYEEVRIIRGECRS
jgi:hypothetical protein